MQHGIRVYLAELERLRQFAKQRIFTHGFLLPRTHAADLDINEQCIYFNLSQTFHRELGRRQANYDSVMNAGRTMINENKVEDPKKLEERLDDLRMRWEAISALANTKQDR